MAKAKTFLDGKTIQVEILSIAPSSTGLLVVELEDGQKIVRHITKLEPLDDESSTILNMEWKKPSDN